MNDKEYLQHIAASSRPVQKPKTNNFLSSITFKVIIGGVIAFILIAIIGSMLGNGKGDLRTRSIALKLHLDSTAEVISTYQDNIKSSNLRSNGASFYSVLSNTSQEIEKYLTEKYGYRSGSEDKSLKEEANLNKEELNNDLFEAKINGLLDRIYAHKMDYEISLLLVEENNIYNSSKDELKDIMQTSINSLKALQESFNSFSETK